MNIRQSKYLYYSIILLSLLIIAFSIYYQLGGFKEYEVKAYPEVDYSLAGIEFKGEYNDPAIKSLYEDAQQLVSEGKIKGTVALIDYLDESLNEKEVRFFIGIILNDRVSELPPDYRVRRIKSRGALGVTLDVHPLVRPNKDDIEGLIYASAQEHALEIEDFFLEKHYPNDDMVIEGFVK